MAVGIESVNHEVHIETEYNNISPAALGSEPGKRAAATRQIIYVSLRWILCVMVSNSTVDTSVR